MASQEGNSQDSPPAARTEWLATEATRVLVKLLTGAVILATTAYLVLFLMRVLLWAGVDLPAHPLLSFFVRTGLFILWTGLSVWLISLVWHKRGMHSAGGESSE